MSQFPDLAALFRSTEADVPVVEDVTMNDRRKTEYQASCVVQDLKCGECGSVMILRRSKKFNSLFYGCSKFPECKGSHGAHPDGRPLGLPGNRRTSLARIHAHDVFDRLWKQRRMTRSAAYAWMKRVMDLPEDAAHIGHLTSEQCERLVKLIKEQFPGVRSVWERLRENPYADADASLKCDE